jgi:hypothetical protein
MQKRTLVRSFSILLFGLQNVRVLTIAKPPRKLVQIKWQILLAHVEVRVDDPALSNDQKVSMSLVWLLAASGAGARCASAWAIAVASREDGCEAPALRIFGCGERGYDLSARRTGLRSFRCEGRGYDFAGAAKNPVRVFRGRRTGWSAPRYSRGVPRPAAKWDPRRPSEP